MNIQETIREFYTKLTEKCQERDDTVNIQVIQTNLLQGDGFDFIIRSGLTGKTEVFNLVHNEGEWHWQPVWFA